MVDHGTHHEDGSPERHAQEGQVDVREGHVGEPEHGGVEAEHDGHADHGGHGAHGGHGDHAAMFRDRFWVTLSSPCR